MENNKHRKQKEYKVFDKILFFYCIKFNEYLSGDKMNKFKP